MNKNLNPSLQSALNGNYKFNFENYISRGFDITGMNGIGYIGFTILCSILAIIAGSIPQIGEYVNTIFLIPTLTVGYYIMAHNISMNKGFHFDQFFEGFQDIGQLALVALVPFAINTILFLISDQLFNSGSATWLQDFQENPLEVDPYTIITNISLAAFLISIPLIYLTVAWSFAPMFVVFYKMSAWEALETSRQLITKRWFTFFLFQILLVIIGFAGALLICIGLLYFIPAILNSYYVAFEDITKFYEEHDEDDILEHLVD